MTRPLARRLTVLTALGGCLAAATMPALAQTPDVDVDVVFSQADSSRQFFVRNLADDGEFRSITFSNDDRAEAFRTVVEEENRLLDSGGYQVNARMTNLYRVDATKPGGYDFDTAIPSSAISLSYGSNPLRAVTSLPVVPRIRVSGTLGDCSDSGIAGLLGIAPLPLVTDLTAYLSALGQISDPVVKGLCDALSDAAGEQIDLLVDGAQQTVDDALALADLPFALTGGQGGSFAQPSYEGAIASLDPAKGADPATSKRIMTGTPNAVGNLTDGLIADIDAALAALLADVPALGAGTDGQVSLAELRTALSAVSPALTTALEPLTDAKEIQLLQDLVFTLLPVDLSSLTTSTASYLGYPVLQVSPSATRAGSYAGTLVVDFFDTDEAP